MRADDLAGILPPIPTPFTAAGGLDLPALARNLEHWHGFALAGYVVLGSNGEGAHLDETETDAVVAAARAAIPADRLMIVGTGRQGTAATVAASRRAADLGADAVLVLPPAYYRSLMTTPVLVEHFHAVADASPVPVVVYNMPACTGLDLDADTVVEIAAHPDVVGLKDSAGDVAKLGEIARRAGDGFALLAGSAGFLLPALSVGATGGVLGLANVAPRACLEVMEAFARGDRDTARGVQQRLARPNRAVTRQWGVPALKAALDMLGLHGGPPRRPLRPLDDTRRGELRAILATAGLLPADQGDEPS